MVVAYPIFTVATCIKAGSLSSLLAVSGPFKIVQRNGLGALWWGVVPFIINTAVGAIVGAQMDYVIDRAETKFWQLYGNKNNNNNNNDENKKVQNQWGHILVRQAGFLVKSAVCALVACPLEVLFYFWQAQSMKIGAKQALAGCGLWGIRYLWRQGGIIRFFQGVQNDIIYHYARSAIPDLVVSISSNRTN